jgi:hypothetical protein
MDDEKEVDFTEVTISADEYEKLMSDAVWLQCLESAGVHD